MQAIYITNGGFDAVLVPDKTVVFVDKEVMQHFIAAQHNGDDFSNWHGTDDWPEVEGYEDGHDYDDEMWAAAESMGDIVAYYDAGRLHIRDERVWHERKEFWGVE